MMLKFTWHINLSLKMIHINFGAYWIRISTILIPDDSNQKQFCDILGEMQKLLIRQKGLPAALATPLVIRINIDFHIYWLLERSLICAT